MKRELIHEELSGKIIGVAMDVLNELTRILPPPTWLNLLEITRAQVTIAGETGQTAPLLQIIDSSPLFQGTEFAMPPLRTPTGEAFRIRTTRRTR